ncbi:MAG: hypothetical protein JNJ82_21215, partial [Opitutaceae bacterium]|nr:hypothetical protein [Opitutaceae bacterium]
MSSSPNPLLPIKTVTVADAATPGEQTAARELARLTGATYAPGAAGGVRVAVATRGRPTHLPASADATSAWIWLQIGDDGRGEVCATHGAFLYAAVRLLAGPISGFTRE